MNPTSKYTVGVRFGLIAAILYIILLFCRFRFFGTNTQNYFTFSIFTYVAILICFLIAAVMRRKELGGYAHLREIFQSVFISILIAETAYVLFVFIYLRWVDPLFVKNFHDLSLAYFHTLPLTPEEIDSRIKGVDSLAVPAKPSALIMGFGPAVVIDSIFGFVFAFILRKQKPVSAEPKI